MTRDQFVPAAGFVVLVVVYAALSGLWTSSDPAWYAGLARPSWQPPPWVFGVVWPLNFVALLASGVGLSARTSPGRAGVPLAVFAASVALALAWAYLFYVPHALGVAAAALAGAAVLTWVLVVIAGRLVAWTGLVLVPYALWMTVATSLAIGYWRFTR
jgi:tryptophan-rich sensory protein